MPRTETQRRRLLLLAFHCSPDHGSEWGNGWNRALQCAQQFDTWAICQGDEQAREIEQYLDKNGPIPGLQFKFISQQGCHEHPVHVHGRRWVAYKQWHQQAFHLAKQLHEAHRFDMIHQVTNCAFREPGLLWKLDVPFIWGPIGGMHNVPWRFLSEFGVKHGVVEGARSVLNSLQLNCSLRGRAAARRATALLVANSTAQVQFQRIHGVEPIRLLDVGISSLAPPKVQRQSSSEPLRILWSGQFTPRKALPLLLKALATIPANVPFQLRVMGGGKLEREWRGLALRLQLDEHIEWLGWLSHAESLRQYEWADLFAFTSLRDNSGTVVLEALANSLPIVCLDHQGTRDIVTPECGLKVPVVRPSQVVSDLRQAIVTLAKDPARRTVMGRSARVRAEQYLWSHLGGQMAQVYRQVMQEASTFTASDDEAATAASVAVDRMSATDGVVTFPRNRFRDATTWGAQRVAAGLHAVFGDRRDDSFGILMYHRVADWPSRVSTPTSNVTPDRFRRQLEGLIARGFEAWSLRKLLDYNAAALPIPKNAFAVTFDDGYENNLLNAVPVLEELNVPATVFLATAFLDSDRPFPFDNWAEAGSTRVSPSSWRPLTTRQCHQLADHPLIEIGAHTHTHGAFSDSVDDFRDDLAKSVEILEDRFHISRPTFSFPFGVANRHMTDVAKQTGVACALTTRSACVPPGADPFDWGRYSADDRDTVATLTAKLHGWYTPVADMLRILKRPLAAIAPQAIGELVPLKEPCFESSTDRNERVHLRAHSPQVRKLCEQTT
jgi:glycosyltransferase involved in cell wall biosynthesis/peptidoglycan/xylan/chitin deacetylase (PgdA/CDA1 family)